MTKLTFFQVAILIGSGFFLVLAVLIFSGIIPVFKDTPGGVGGEVIMWGTFPSTFLREPLDEVNRNSDRLFTVTYIQKNADSFADGEGPARNCGLFIL